MVELPRLWHVREPGLQIGDAIAPGRWGAMVLERGAAHPHFFREHLLELARLTRRDVPPVSRLTCAYAHESRASASALAARKGKACFEVEAVDPNPLASRHDVLWITWLAEPGTTFADVLGWLDGYWSGLATEDVAAHAHTEWEWLIASGLRIVGHA